MDRRLLENIIHQFIINEYVRSDKIDQEKLNTWLIKHYSDERKLTIDRMEALNQVKFKFPCLKPPKNIDKVYRGLANVSEGDLEKLKKARFSNPEIDKSWTIDKKIAQDFANDKWKIMEKEPEKFAVILIAKFENSKTLMNFEEILKIKEVANFYHKKWKEPLSKTLKREKEVLTFKPLKILDIEFNKN